MSKETFVLREFKALDGSPVEVKALTGFEIFYDVGGVLCVTFPEDTSVVAASDCARVIWEALIEEEKRSGVKAPYQSVVILPEGVKFFIAEKKDSE